MVASPQVWLTRSPEFFRCAAGLVHVETEICGDCSNASRICFTSQWPTRPPGAILNVDTNDWSRKKAFAFAPHEFVGKLTFVPKVGAYVTVNEDGGTLSFMLWTEKT